MTTPTTQEFQAAWIKALQEERFPGGTGQLHSTKGYCCLGVACEVGIELGLGIERDGENYKCGEATRLGSLPQLVQNALGLHSDMGRSISGVNDALYLLNDDKRLTHKEIAEHLLSHYDDYFLPLAPSQDTTK